MSHEPEAIGRHDMPFFGIPDSGPGILQPMFLLDGGDEEVPVCKPVSVMVLQ